MKNERTNNDFAAKRWRKTLGITLAFSISDALKMLSEGRVEQARCHLEDSLRYANATSAPVSEHVGLDQVRSGKGFC